MGNTISYVEATQSYSATVINGNAVETGTRQVSMGEQKQKDLNNLLEKKKKELDALRAEMDAINGKSGFEKTMGGLYGSDCGAADVKAKTERAQAELRRCTDEIKATQATIDMLMQEIQGAQQNLSDSISDSQKTKDESDRAAREAAGG
jgi:chromosome segregation ATPase